MNAIAMPFSFAAAIDSSSLIDPPRLETGVRLAICDSLSLATVVLLNDLGASALESQNRKPDSVLFVRFLLFCGAILLLANAIDKEPAVARI